MASNKPEARNYINSVLNHGRIDEYSRLILKNALNIMTRKRYKPVRANVTSQAMTPELRQRIKDEYYKDPSAQMKDIAAKLGVNQGRVSETFHTLNPKASLSLAGASFACDASSLDQVF